MFSPSSHHFLNHVQILVSLLIWPYRERKEDWLRLILVILFDLLILVEDGAACQETVCELRLGNYTRHDPTTIECVADNSKSTRISKVFHVDVYCKRQSMWSNRSMIIVARLDPPKVITNLRTFTGSRSIDILLECSSISNPPGSIIWLDDQREEIHPDQQPYTIKVTNQSSALSFSVVCDHFDCHWRHLRLFSSRRKAIQPSLTTVVATILLEWMKS